MLNVGPRLWNSRQLQAQASYHRTQYGDHLLDDVVSHDKNDCSDLIVWIWLIARYAVSCGWRLSPSATSKNTAFIGAQGGRTEQGYSQPDFLGVEAIALTPNRIAWP